MTDGLDIESSKAVDGTSGGEVLVFVGVDSGLRLTISTAPAEIDSLYEWLLADRELAGVATISPVVSPDPSTMSALEVIDVVLTHVEAAISLLLAFATWRQTRPVPEPVVVTRGDGATLTISSESEAAADVITAFVTAGQASTPRRG
jgi:hypothetical protein